MNTLVICLIICTLSIISYMWGKVSMATTAMVSFAAFVITGCLSPQAALENFGNSNGIMIMSMFVVAAGLQRTQFVKHVAHSVNGIARGSITKVMFGYVTITIILSQFIQSPLIVFGIMAPMMLATCKDMGINPSRVMFALGIAAIATCSALPLGSGATVAAELNGYLEANAYTSYVVQLTDPMLVRFPIVIVAAIYCIFFAVKFAPETKMEEKNSQENVQKRELPPLAPLQEKAGYFIFILTTLALIFQRSIPKAIIMPTWMICFVGALAMVVFGVLKAREATDAMNIPMYLLFVGSMTMGAALAETGAGTVVGDYLANMANSIGNPYIIGAIFFIIPFLMTQVMQNRAVMLIFIPIAIQACKSMGANPIGIIILVQAATLTAFMTPMATAAVPMYMAAGNYSLKDVLKQSIIPAIVFSVVSIFWTMTIIPLH